MLRVDKNQGSNKVDKSGSLPYLEWINNLMYASLTKHIIPESL